MINSTSDSKSLFTGHLLSSAARAERLIYIGDQAYSLRHRQMLLQVGLALCEMSVRGVYFDAGVYFKALAVGSDAGSRAQAEAVMRSVAEEGSSPIFRARALLALGGYHLLESKAEHAARLYHKARHLAPDDAYILLSTGKMLAVIKSLDGNHGAALSELEDLIPVARIVGTHFPAHRLDFENSLAAELHKVGRTTEARRVIKPVIVSPVAGAYPEWHETADEVSEGEGRRRQVAVPFVTLRNQIRYCQRLLLNGPEEAILRMYRAAVGLRLGKGRR